MINGIHRINGMACGREPLVLADRCSGHMSSVRHKKHILTSTEVGKHSEPPVSIGTDAATCINYQISGEEVENCGTQQAWRGGTIKSSPSQHAFTGHPGMDKGNVRTLLSVTAKG